MGSGGLRWGEALAAHVHAQGVGTRSVIHVTWNDWAHGEVIDPTWDSPDFRVGSDSRNACRPAFARWMIDRCLPDAELPPGDPDEVIVEISHDDDIGDDLDAAGENSLAATGSRWLRCPRGCYLFHLNGGGRIEWSRVTVGSMVRWFDGSMVRWFDGSMVRWFDFGRSCGLDGGAEVVDELKFSRPSERSHSQPIASAKRMGDGLNRMTRLPPHRSRSSTPHGPGMRRQQSCQPGTVP